MKKKILAGILTATMLISMTACGKDENKKEDKKEEKTTEQVQENEPDETDEVVADKDVAEDDTTQSEESSEEVADDVNISDTYAYSWLRRQDFSQGQIEQPATIPMFGGLDAGFSLSGQSFSGWYAATGYTEDRSDIVYSTLEEIIQSDELTVRAEDDDFYTFSQTPDAWDDITFNVTFVNMSEEKMTTKQLYENGWWYMTIYNIYGNETYNNPYPEENPLFIHFGYTPNFDGQGMNKQNEYLFMDYFLSLMGSPNFMSMYTRNSTTYPSIDEAIELIKDPDNFAYANLNLGWTYDGYSMFVNIYDDAKISAINEGTEYTDVLDPLIVQSVTYFPASCYEHLNYESEDDNDKYHIGANLLPEWNEKIQNGEILKTE